MRFFQRLIVCFTMLLVSCFMAGAAQVSAQCPTPDKIQGSLKKLFPNVELGAIQPSEVKGLCQVQVKTGRPNPSPLCGRFGGFFSGR